MHSLAWNQETVNINLISSPKKSLSTSQNIYQTFMVGFNLVLAQVGGGK